MTQPEVEMPEMSAEELAGRLTRKARYTDRTFDNSSIGDLYREAAALIRSQAEQLTALGERVEKEGALGHAGKVEPELTGKPEATPTTCYECETALVSVCPHCNDLETPGRLRALLRGRDDFIVNKGLFAEFVDTLEATPLAASQSTPVATSQHASKILPNDPRKAPASTIEVALSKARQIAALTVPAPPADGWKLVPVEPTEGMLAAIEDAMMPDHEDPDAAVAYAAMLSAAPNPDVAPTWPKVADDHYSDMQAIEREQHQPDVAPESPPTPAQEYQRFADSVTRATDADMAGDPKRPPAGDA